ncbi:site-2 protease family protein [Brevibacillus fluminis]|uniref:Site-2 protease family protein n=1 Tax=Brevibacillus fluminis TaxID=511487 RepID=A0A3M8D2A3_9BACL|nr:site-2 protease family protein [Brevibacillus fluminis]RNB81577.1 site-2 protease family protein [Brevibacillus fluminis]
MDFSNLFHFDWSTVPFRMIAFVIAFSLHEWAHAFVAWRLGDNTARNEGRLTVNPIPHIDPFGLILILFGPFGWAKPVPINPLHFRGNKRLGIVYVSAAGPIVNLVLAFLFCLLFIAADHSAWVYSLSDKWAAAVMYTLGACITINCGLFVFNLLPIPPLDGSKIFRFLAPRSWEPFFYKLEMYGPWVLLLMIFIPGLSTYILGTPLVLLLNVIQTLAARTLGY